MDLIKRYRQVRQNTANICEPLEIEDYTIQSAPEISPPKWHLGHTSWFFEQFILAQYAPNYRCEKALFLKIFNSYYKSFGEHWPRQERGVLSRPTVKEVYDYREDIDRQMIALMGSEKCPEISKIVEIGLHHEEQHQELLLMDIQHILAQNPEMPVYRPMPNLPKRQEIAPLSFISFTGGLVEIGKEQDDKFAFDNEYPKHIFNLSPFQLAKRLITNAEFLEFIADGGYTNFHLWSAPGWDFIQKNNRRAPLYWHRDPCKGAGWWHRGLSGEKSLVKNAPLAHITYYEAQAFAQWKKMRLPTEQEWEYAFGHPQLTEMHGELWQWTESAYLPYPEHKRLPGALGEYNYKFMCGQMVLKGSSAATPEDHFRKTYRNFYYPQDSWQFSGLRLAKNS